MDGVRTAISMSHNVLHNDHPCSKELESILTGDLESDLAVAIELLQEILDQTKTTAKEPSCLW